jgi:hypothetical protein
MSQDCQGTLNAVIAPSRILFSHWQHEFNDLLRRWRVSSALAAAAIVPVPGNELPMPSQDCFGNHDGDKLVNRQEGFDGEPPAPVIVRQDAFPGSSEDPVFSMQVIDGLLLSAIDY